MLVGAMLVDAMVGDRLAQCWVMVGAMVGDGWYNVG